MPSGAGVEKMMTFGTGTLNTEVEKNGLCISSNVWLLHPLSDFPLQQMNNENCDLGFKSVTGWFNWFIYGMFVDWRHVLLGTHTHLS